MSELIYLHPDCDWRLLRNSWLWTRIPTYMNCDSCPHGDLSATSTASASHNSSVCSARRIFVIQHRGRSPTMPNVYRYTLPQQT